MLTFRMDETNFAEGDRAGVRIASGEGLKVDFDEFAADGQTLGLWHLHDGCCQGEGTGLEDSSGGGHDFSNSGAASVEDGYQFARDEADYMDAAFASQPARSLVTLETWVRGWGNPNGARGSPFYLHESAAWSHRLFLYVNREAVPASSYMAAGLRLNGGEVSYILWQSADVADLLDSGDPWHVAVVLDAVSTPKTFRLFVNGIKRAEGSGGAIAALPAADYRLKLAREAGASGYVSAVIDEVRLSAAARYPEDLTPDRLLASGTFTAPTFDGVRLQADWTDLVRTQGVPGGCEIDWQVRAGDETDVNGAPQALWQPYSGDPQALPDGRYFQWRATLSASEDHLASPTVESVETLASEAGYNLYHASGTGPESLDYDEPWAQVAPSVTDAETDALDVENVHWFGIRPADPNGRESPVAQGEVRLEINAQGEQEPDRPAGALAASAAPLPLGAARLQWRYRIGLGGVLPQTFRIFGDGGTGTIDYETPLDEVPWCEGQAWYAWTSDPLTPGAEHQLAVRAVTAGAVWDEQPAVARVTPDAVPPGQVDALEAEVTP